MKPQHHFAPGVIVGGSAPRRRLPKAVLTVCLVIVIACVSAAGLLLEGARP